MVEAAILNDDDDCEIYSVPRLNCREHCQRLRYRSTNSKIGKVSSPPIVPAVSMIDDDTVQ
jgi:hypothetical protein